MNILDEVFSRYIPDYKKLKAYGFRTDNGFFIYEKEIMDGAFLAQIRIDEKGKIEGKLIDRDLNEEYTNIYTAHYGAYVSIVREAYTALLEEIRDGCFRKQSFISPQSRRIAAYMQKEYGARPEFVFKKFPDYAVFRNNGKWFAIIMNIAGKKIGTDVEEVEIIDVRSDPCSIASLKDEKGFHEAYHMNKDSWITIELNDSVDDEIIFSMIDASYLKTELFDAWLVPANPKYYDVVGEFDRNDEILWKQSSDIHVGDIVYLYVGAPYSTVLYKSEVVESDIPYEYKGKDLSISRVMKIKKLKRYPEGKYTFEYLNLLGIRAVRGPRRIRKEISEKFV
ncbi:MAG: MmcQ/YjbR family DNA-binding protein [Erysipelotrichaceae bacterium]|nr:MmcQ/YjbR family DNA-binding protein [Erysipelotrichaceae bacterium]